MDNSSQPPLSQPPVKQLLNEAEKNPEVAVPPQKVPDSAQKPRSKNLVTLLRFLVVGGGLFIMFVIGLGISFSACFTIKGPPPPQCAPVSIVSLILMPGGSLFFLIPMAKKIK